MGIKGYFNVLFRFYNRKVAADALGSLKLLHYLGECYPVFLSRHSLGEHA